MSFLKSKNIIKKSISNILAVIKENKKYEICVSCGAMTDYEFSTPIEERLGYVEGCGQMCKKCYEESKFKRSYGYTPEQIAMLREICSEENSQQQ